MTNYEAIKHMTAEQLEIFLDHVYLTGMNNALYLSRLTEDEAAAYSGIGINKLRDITNDDASDIVLWAGTKRLLKQKQLDSFIDWAFSI